ncbi:Protein CBG27071 [Caenorhabditis briggsae]|uniref:Uncharacterized protein n=2 Tax=Caenorhabditis briggsae TaxID=6238 RepID=A0AAE9JKT7_CAEBR|nr:Protein CBG27071 [Caenorhabditis briggsae]ULT89409.1 hypothetical protein L3Y34_008108 [Caenorhabditis briggsae]UMM35228.1 hypothetical protein L5515_007954 [Caenorhabditis briggsae]CAR99327.1 Protein CBG27071 [Caenorhabditis briggsae]
MQPLVAVVFFLFLLIGSSQSAPLFKDIDYKLFDNTADNGVAIDSIFEFVPETSTDNKKRPHRRSTKHH